MKSNTESTVALSIVMCTFNRGHLISESIQSCLDQTLQSWELIVVDDYSTDHTANIVEKFDDPRIIFIKSSAPKGRSNARNVGLAMSKGKFISFLDSDDLIDPRKLETDIEFLQTSEIAGAVYSTAVCKEIDSGQILGIYGANQYGNLYDSTAFYLPLIIATSQVTIKRDIYQNVGGFDSELDRFEDTDFFRRVSLVTNWIANPEEMVILKNHADNTISNQSQQVIIKMIDRYVSKVENEIATNFILTKATPDKLYLHYAQALFVQKNGTLPSLRLYLNLLKKRPSSLPKIVVSFLKMVKHRYLLRFMNDKR